MNKKVSIGKRPGARPTAEAIDQWLEKQSAAADGAGETPAVAAAPAEEPPDTEIKSPAVKMKRLTIDIPDSLHRRVKSRCGQEGWKMADVVRDLLENRFPVL
jgi:hypothetical protein